MKRLDDLTRHVLAQPRVRVEDGGGLDRYAYEAGEQVGARQVSHERVRDRVNAEVLLS